MKSGDVVIPFVNRFPEKDLKGNSIELEDDFLDRPAMIIVLRRTTAEIRSLDTGKTAIYRPDELRLHCTAEEWRLRVTDLIAV